jgi:hypothetical protein
LGPVLYYAAASYRFNPLSVLLSFSERVSNIHNTTENNKATDSYLTEQPSPEEHWV